MINSSDVTVKDNYGDTARAYDDGGGTIFLELAETATGGKRFAVLAMTPKRSKKLRRALKAAERSAKQ